MENIIEFLVKKERTAKDILKVFGLYLAAFALTFVGFLFLKDFAILVAIAAVYGAYWLSQKLNLEYEYCVVNKDIQIDKIMGKKKRKPLLTVEESQIVAIYRQSEQKNNDFANQTAKEFFVAEKTQAAENYVLLINQGTGYARVIMKWDDRMVNHFKRVMPSKMLSV